MARPVPLPAALGAAAAFALLRWAAGRRGCQPPGLILILVSPVIEEMIYRGILYRSLKPETGRAAAAGISALLFALGHRGWARMGLSLLFGLGAAWITERTGRLRGAALAHIGWNLIWFLMQ